MAAKLFQNNSLKTAIQRFYASQPQIPLCDFKPQTYKGPSIEKLHKIRKTNLNPALTTLYSTPLALHQGHKQWLFDIHGRRYLDMFGGIVTVSVGHCHPKVCDAITQQMNTLGHVTNIYMHPKVHEYAEKLAEKLPGDLKVVYFVNSGSEANDLAILLARLYTNNFDIISLTNSYHGMSSQTMALTASSNYRFPVPQPPGFHHAMNPDVYRGIWGGANCRDSPVQTNRHCSCNSIECVAKDNYIEQLDEVFKYNLPKNRVAAFIAESIQGVGGTVQFPKGYLKAAAKKVRKNGGIFIADEVQTGFGRTGDHFWGFESHGILPDIVTMAKGIGNGFPLGAVVTTPEIAKALTFAMHFNTYGGNPLASAAGIAVLDVIEEEKLQDNSKRVGTHLLIELAKLQSKFPVIGDVRGKGLMIGIELVAGDGTTTPLSPDKFMKVWESCRDMGVLIGKGGYHGNVMRIKPPMCITKEDADFTVAVLKKSLEKL